MAHGYLMTAPPSFPRLPRSSMKRLVRALSIYLGPTENPEGKSRRSESRRGTTSPPTAKRPANLSRPARVLIGAAWARPRARSPLPTILPCRGLVLDSSYSKLPDAGAGWWYFGAESRFVLLVADRFRRLALCALQPVQVDVAEAVKKLRSSSAQHGDVDSLASPKQAARNLEAVGERGEIVWFEGCGHSEAAGSIPNATFA